MSMPKEYPTSYATLCCEPLCWFRFSTLTEMDYHLPRKKRELVDKPVDKLGILGE